MMRIAALQMQAVPGNAEANLGRIGTAMAEAAAMGARLLVAPELALTGYGAGETITRLAESAEACAQRLADLAARHGIAVLAGFAERDGDRIYNSAVFADRASPPVIYRKSHLYGPYEKDLFSPEQPSSRLFELDGITCGILICYDVEFPENVRRLALAGARAVLVPTALPRSPHAALIARKMIPVRAFENQIFVAYVNHCGADRRFVYAGLSAIAAPDGSMLAEAPGHDEALLLADIRPDEYARSAAENSYLADLRR